MGKKSSLRHEKRLLGFRARPLVDALEDRNLPGETFGLPWSSLLGPGMLLGMEALLAGAGSKETATLDIAGAQEHGHSTRSISDLIDGLSHQTQRLHRVVSEPTSSRIVPEGLASAIGQSTSNFGGQTWEFPEGMQDWGDSLSFGAPPSQVLVFAGAASEASGGAGPTVSVSSGAGGAAPGLANRGSGLANHAETSVDQVPSQGPGSGHAVPGGTASQTAARGSPSRDIALQTAAIATPRDSATFGGQSRNQPAQGDELPPLESPPTDPTPNPTPAHPPAPPIIFEQNLGQTDDQVKFLARVPGYTLFLTASEMVMVVDRQEAESSKTPAVESDNPRDELLADMRGLPPKAKPADVLRMKFGGNTAASVEGRERVQSVSNYYRGNDPSRWVTGAPHYTGVAYDEIYSGIDLVYYANADGDVEYDFVVAPGADASQIQLDFVGATELEVNADGDLVVDTPGNELVQRAPTIYQEHDGVRETVSGAYALEDADSVAFVLGTYDATRPLVIDPVIIAPQIIYSTFLGGTSADYVTSLGVSDEGHAIVTGITESADFPVEEAFDDELDNGPPQFYSDAFVTKFALDGETLVYSTFLGGFDDEIGNGIDVDDGGNAHVGGTTISNDFPTTSDAPRPAQSGGPPNGFYSVFSPSGQLTFSTYVYPDPIIHPDYEPWTVCSVTAIVEDEGEVYVTGNWGQLAHLPLPGPGPGGPVEWREAYYADPTAANDFHKFGGNGIDFPTAIAMPDGAPVVVGYTDSSTGLIPSGYATHDDTFGGGIYDGFVYGAGFASYIGGSGKDEAHGIVPAPHSPGVVLITGGTNTPDLADCDAYQPLLDRDPETETGAGDAFLLRLNIGGSVAEPEDRWEYFTYLGGGSGDIGYEIAVNSEAQIIIAGQTLSAGDFPLELEVDVFSGVASEAFATVFDPTGRYVDFSTVLAGFVTSVGYGVAADTNRNIYVGGFTNDQMIYDPIIDFPLVNAFQDTYHGGGSDGFVTKIQLGPDIKAFRRTWDPYDGIRLEQTGNVDLEHELDLDLSPGRLQSHNSRLVYNSDDADLRPILHAVIALPDGFVLSPEVKVEVVWDGIIRPFRVVSTDNLGPGGKYLVAGQLDEFGLATPGEHTYRLRVTLDYPELEADEDPVLRSKEQKTYTFPLHDSPFGAGWNLSTLERLVYVPPDEEHCDSKAGLLRVMGSGGWRYYLEEDDGEFHPTRKSEQQTRENGSGDDGVFEVEGTGFVHVAADGQKRHFTRPNEEDTYLTLQYWESTDHAEKIEFTYLDKDDDFEVDDVVTMKAIDGTITTFVYSGSTISSIQAPGGKTYTLTNGGELSAITNPTGGGTRTFEYHPALGPDDILHRVKKDTWGALVTSWEYTDAGTVKSFKEGAIHQFLVEPQAYYGYERLVAGDAPKRDGKGTPPAIVTDPAPLNHETQWELDARGRPVEYTDRADGKWEWEYTGSNWVKQATDALDRKTSYDRDGKGYVTRETLPDGKTRQYVYGQFQRLVSFINERGFQTVYTYDGLGHRLTERDVATGITTTFTYWTAGAAAGLLHTLVNPRGFTTTYQYDTYRRLQSTINPLGPGEGTTEFEYDGRGNPLTVTDPLSRVTTTIYDAMGRLKEEHRPLGHSWLYDYDEPGQLLETTNPLGVSTEYKYDDRGIRSQVDEAVGEPEARTTTTLYDATGNLHNHIAQSGDVTQYRGRRIRQLDVVDLPHAWDNVTLTENVGRMTTLINGRGFTATFLFDVPARKVTEIDPLLHRTTSIYDAVGNLKEITNARSVQTTFQYDPRNRLTHTTEAANQAAQYRRTTINAYDGVGNIQSVTDGRGTVTSFQYDSLNRRTKIIAAYNQPEQSTTLIEYDATSNVIHVNTGVSTNSNYAHSASTVYAYDSIDRRIAVIEAFLSPEQRTTTIAYDTLGNRRITTNQLLQTTVEEYDDLDRLKKVTEGLHGLEAASTPDRRFTAYEYDALGNLRSVTTGQADGETPEGYPHPSTTSFACDALNRRTKVIDGFGSPDERTTEFHYDDNDNLDLLTDPLGRATIYVYNAVDLPIEIIEAFATPDERTTEIAFDAVGNQVSVTTGIADDPAYDHVVTTGFLYDPLNRREQITEAANDAALQRTTTLKYDFNDNVEVQTNYLGHRTTYTYDRLDRRTSVTDPVGSVTSTEYDAAGNVVKVTLPPVTGFPLTIVSEYDALNRLVKVDEGGRITEHKYDDRYNLTRTIDQRGNTTTLVYDKLNRKTGMQNPEGHWTTMVYDAADNVANVKVTDYHLTNLVTYTTTHVYDALNRKRSTTDPRGKTTTYEFDDADNLRVIVNRNGVTHVRTPDYLNRVIAESWTGAGGSLSASYAFDAADNLLLASNEQGTYVRTYDTLNRMTTSNQPLTIQLTYGYGNDAANNFRRTVTDSRGGTTTSTYDPAGRLKKREYLDGLNQPIRIELEYEPRHVASTITYYKHLTDNSQQVAYQQLRYNPFAEVTEIYWMWSSSWAYEGFTYHYHANGDLRYERRVPRRDDGEIHWPFRYETTQDIGFDKTRQLTNITVDNGLPTNRQYSPTGHRLSQGEVIENNRIVRDNTYRYEYDDEGNLLRQIGVTEPANPVNYTQYTFNQRNELVKVEYVQNNAVAGRIENAYDVFGNRSMFSEWVTGSPTTVTYCAYDGKQLIADLGPGPNHDVKIRYLRNEATNQLFARLDATNGRMFYFTDRTNSVLSIVDANGLLKKRERYQGFSSTHYPYGPYDLDRFEYLGKEVHFPFGPELQWDGHGWFDPQLERWLSETAKGDPNPHRYRGNNPLRPAKEASWTEKAWQWFEGHAAENAMRLGMSVMEAQKAYREREDSSDAVAAFIAKYSGAEHWLTGPNTPTQILDDAQNILDGIGMIPILGEPADVINGLIHLGRGNKVDAGLSFAGAIPFAGWGATAAKWARRAPQIIDTIRAGAKGLNAVGDAGRVAAKADGVGAVVLNSARRKAWTESFGEASSGLGRVIRDLPKGHETRREFARMLREIRAASGVASRHGLSGGNYGRFVPAGRTGLFQYQPGKLRIVDFLEEQTHWKQITAGIHERLVNHHLSRGLSQDLARQRMVDTLEILAKQRVLQHPGITPVLRMEWLDDIARVKAGTY